MEIIHVILFYCFIGNLKFLAILLAAIKMNKHFCSFSGIKASKDIHAYPTNDGLS